MPKAARILIVDDAGSLRTMRWNIGITFGTWSGALDRRTPA